MGAHEKPRRLWRLRSVAIASLLVGAGLVWAATPSLAVHDNGMFELDGNTVHNSASTPPYDWNSLFNASGSRILTPDPINGPLLGSAFVQDTATPDSSYFASNKDIQPIPSWGCGPINNPLNKDDLQNAYAALVQVPNNAPDNAGHKVLYLGSERDSNNGTSFAGFWLLKDSGVGCSAGGNFTGGHTNGDILIVSDYTNGGGTQDVSVYKWVGGNTATSTTANLTLVTSGGVCGTTAKDSVCAIANAAAITTPWAPTSHESNTFVETGIDLTTLLGQLGGCFTTFLAETRSSAELTATLKDFAGGQFNTCAPPPITTTATPGGSVNAPGSAQHDVAHVGTANIPAVGSVKFYLCQPNEVTAGGCEGTAGAQVGGSVSLDANGAATSAVVNGTTTPNDNTPGKYCWRTVFTPSPNDQHYVGGTETNASVGDADSECFVIVRGHPTITTEILVTGDNAPGLGFTHLGDMATLHNFIGNVAGNIVNFALYDVTANPGCTGAPVFTTTGTLDASGSATTSTTYEPTAAHTYTWIASYLATTPPNNDLLNDDAVGKCGDENESVTIVGAHIDVSKSANPAGPVTAGQNIGFDITVSNQGAVPATGVHVHDVLPAKATGAASGDLNWTLTPHTGCSVTGAVGSQVLDCDLGTVGPNTTVLPVIHLTSPTTAIDCGVVTNVASVSTTNGTGADSDPASVTVQCPNLSLTKVADHDTVSAGGQIGFTVTVTNSGSGTALGVVINDPLPAGPGIDWSIASGPANCSIQGSPPNEVLHCTAVDLAAGQSESVHVVSNTTPASCGLYKNVAVLTATNSGQLTATDDTTVQCANLTLTKTADAVAVDAGTPIGFTVTVSNSNAPGTGTAIGVVINDPLPSGPGIDWSIASGPPNCAIQGSPPTEILHCTAVDLAPGQSESVHVVSNTSFLSCGAYNNTATLTVTNAPGQSADAAETVLCADIDIEKIADAQVVDVGSDIGFTVTITNNGDGVANGVDVEDPLPAGSGVDWSIDKVSGPLTCSIAGSPPSETLKCTGTLAATGDVNGNNVQTVHVTSATQFKQNGDGTINSCGVYDNTATVTWSHGLALPISSNEASEQVICPALTLLKTADAQTVSAGDSIGFTITVSNGNANNTGNALSVVINDPLPSGPGIDWSIASGPPNCAITGAPPAQTLHCDPVSLHPGDGFTVHIVSDTTFASCKAYPNTASLTATNHPPVSAEDTTTVVCPELTLVKTADAATVNAGEQIGFTITASNGGSGTAKGVTINDPLPSGDGVDWSIEAGPANCSIDGSAPDQTLTCTAVDLPPGSSESVHVVSDTEFASCGTYDNTATLTLTNGDTPLTAHDTTTVTCPSLGLTKTADAASVQAGKQIGFTITVTNDGPGTATEATLSDPLPSGKGVSWAIDAAETTAMGCSISGGTDSQVLKCALGDLAANASVAVHIVSGTTDSSCATYANVATVEATNAAKLTAQASTRVTTCLGTEPEPPVAVTGTPLLGLQIAAGIAFLLVGGATLFIGRRRVPRNVR